MLYIANKHNTVNQVYFKKICVEQKKSLFGQNYKAFVTAHAAQLKKKNKPNQQMGGGPK